jgi:glucose-1-phosphate thymidylyltransferase
MDKEIVGLIPAGGMGSRLGKLPCSKEIFPRIGMTGGISVLSENLIRYFRVAGIENIYFIIRDGKWDIPGYFGDGSEFGVNLGYLMMKESYGTPFTLNQAYPFIHDKIVALGFPDIVFEPEDAFVQLKSKFLQSPADIMLGIVPSEHYLRSDMIEFGSDGRIHDLIIKENRPDLKYSWFIALWRPSFSLYLKNFLLQWLFNNPEGKMRMPDGSFREIYVGDIIRNSIADGLNVDHVFFGDGHYSDLGTWDEWNKFSGIG